MLNYEKKLNDLNNSDEFHSLMTPEEDYEKIMNTEKDISYKEGVHQTKIESAKKLLEEGIPVEVIERTLGISSSELKEIK